MQCVCFILAFWQMAVKHLVLTKSTCRKILADESKVSRRRGAFFKLGREMLSGLQQLWVGVGNNMIGGKMQVEKCQVSMCQVDLCSSASANAALSHSALLFPKYRGLRETSLILPSSWNPLLCSMSHLLCWSLFPSTLSSTHKALCFITIFYYCIFCITILSDAFFFIVPKWFEIHK